MRNKLVVLAMATDFIEKEKTTIASPRTEKGISHIRQPKEAKRIERRMEEI